MQRVKALLTGSLPTFLDVGSVFAGGEIREDNVLLQAMRNGMRVGAVGDDTWTQLFPPSSQAALNLSHPYPSLNVHDLDTVDDGVAAVWSSLPPRQLMHLPRAKLTAGYSCVATYHNCIAPTGIGPVDAHSRTPCCE